MLKRDCKHALLVYQYILVDTESEDKYQLMSLIFYNNKII